MLMNADQPGRIERALGRLPEGSFLKLSLFAVLTAAVTMIGLDVKSVYEADRGFQPGSHRTTPLIMDPPGRKDHLRPYLPKSMPRRRGGGGGTIALSRYDNPPGPKELSGRMTFRLAAKGRAAGVGRIEPGTSGEFERFLAANPGKVRTLVLHSPGGAVNDALEMARLIRQSKLATNVPDNAYCASSCPLVFAGGSRRLAGRHAWIGVHQVYATPSAIGSLHDGMAEAQSISALCQSLLSEMGVDPKVWVHAMSTSKNKLYVFTPEELTKYKLATKLGRN